MNESLACFYDTDDINMCNIDPIYSFEVSPAFSLNRVRLYHVVETFANIFNIYYLPIYILRKLFKLKSFNSTNFSMKVIKVARKQQFSSKAFYEISRSINFHNK